MEPVTTIEHIPFVWGVAFSVDVMVGVITFLSVIRKNVPVYVKGTMTWVGWWSWASALSLVINAVEGANATFSYHQIGVFTETMTNIGVVAWGTIFMFRNWYIKDDDWTEIERVREEITSRNRQREIDNAAK